MTSLALALLFLLIGTTIARWQSCTGKPRLRVMAAASLTQAFQAVKPEFEAYFPQVELELVFAGSQVLTMQVQAGAQADVLASADREHLLTLRDSGDALLLQPIIENRLAIVVPDSEPDRSWRELGQMESWVLGSPQVPVGRYAQQLLSNLEPNLGSQTLARIRNAVVSREPNVRLVRAKVAMRQADAAIVYRSDLTAGSGVKEVPLPDRVQVKARYYASALKASSMPQAAALFIDFLRSPRGQRILQREGFEALRERR